MMEGVSFTYAEMVEKATQVASGLIASGFKPGDRIGIIGPNQSQWAVAMWAVALSGMQLVTINPMYTAPELEYAINKVDIKCLISPQSIGPLDYRLVASISYKLLFGFFKDNCSLETTVPHVMTVSTYNIELL